MAKGGRASLREVFPLVSADQSNPAGLAAGSRGSFRGSRGNDPRTRGLEILASWRDARTARLLVKSAPVRVRSKTGWQQFWHPFWVQEVLSAFTRWSAPFPLADHRLPAANPAGLVSESEIGPHPCRMDLKSVMQPCQAALLTLILQGARAPGRLAASLSRHGYAKQCRRLPEGN